MIDNFNIRDYFGLEGRLGRKSFALRMLFGYAVSYALTFITLSVVEKQGLSPLFVVLIILAFINLAFIYSNILARLRDINRGRIWAIILFCLHHNMAQPPASELFYLIHILGIIFLICKKGSAGENKYGPPPQ